MNLMISFCVLASQLNTSTFAYNEAAAYLNAYLSCKKSILPILAIKSIHKANPDRKCNNKLKFCPKNL